MTETKKNDTIKQKNYINDNLNNNLNNNSNDSLNNNSFNEEATKKFNTKKYDAKINFSKTVMNTNTDSNNNNKSIDTNKGVNDTFKKNTNNTFKNNINNTTTNYSKDIIGDNSYSKLGTDDNTVYATGKRKNAIAKVWLTKGTGKIIINNKEANEYLKRAILNVVINQPFGKTETEGKFDIECKVLGGGLSGQAGAIKHAISIALQLLNQNLRGTLKSAGFLTRDSRIVERKKAGLKKARKGQVYQRR